VTTWHDDTLGHIVDSAGGSIRTGPFGSQLHRHEYVDGGPVAVVMPKDMVGGRIATGSIARISETTASRLSVHRLQPGDIVLARRGDIGRAVWVDGQDGAALCGTGSMRIHLPGGDLLPRFLHYFLQTRAAVEWLRGQAVGATMPNLNDTIVRALPVRYPDQSIQRQVVGVLDAIDDLIENNRRRIELLEEIGQSIYREWFVRFRYPSHEDDELIESAIGPVPARWEVRPISEVVEVFGGGTPSRKEPTYWDGGTITWFTPSDLTKASSMFMFASASHITPEGLAHSSAKIFPSRSVLMTSRATLGVIAISQVEGCTNQGFIVCVPSQRLSEYHLYFWLLENVREFEALASGATFKEITRGAFRKFPVVVPPLETECKFTETLAPICGSVERLSRLNINLHHLRDMLLPKLVTGAIDVSRLDLDALLEESAA
jgi:type I restriction enzyme, S subunit